MKKIFRKYEITLTKNLAFKIIGWASAPMFFWLSGWNILETTRGAELSCGILATLTIGIGCHFAANDLFPRKTETK